jgi:hypothetical protein
MVSVAGDVAGQVVGGDLHHHQVVFQLSANEPTDEEGWEREVRLQARFAEATGIHAGYDARAALQRLLRSGATVTELRQLWRAELLRWDDSAHRLALHLPRSDFWQGAIMMSAALLYLVSTMLGYAFAPAGGFKALEVVVCSALSVGVVVLAQRFFLQPYRKARRVHRIMSRVDAGVACPA